MAQQAVRRIKRTGAPALWKGLLWAIVATVGAVVAFAVIIGLTDVSDGVIRIINQCIKVGAIFLGMWTITSRGDEGAIRRGALLGLLYMGAGVLLYALLTHQQLSWIGYLIDVLMGVAAGGLSGMAIAGMKRK